MTILDAITAVFVAVGAAFFMAGTVGLLRFPDTHSRLHAITKADNLGLGIISLALVLQAGSVPTAAKIVVIWLLVLLASSTSCYLIGRFAAGNPLAQR